MGDYAVVIPAHILQRQRQQNGEADRAWERLPGARMLLANETTQGGIWDDEKVKSLASRDTMAARKLYHEMRDFVPTHKLWIRGNHMPGVVDASDGFWRRILLVHFGVNITEKQKIADLDDQIIRDELPGVLNWMLEGRLAWQKSGLNIPDCMRADCSEYREDTDILGRWIAEFLKHDTRGRASSSAAVLSIVLRRRRCALPIGCLVCP